jgi:hypothetical protein
MAMSFLSRLLGHESEPRNDSRRGVEPPRPSGSDRGSPVRPPTDEQAVERYRYLLRTAPPEAIEQAHAEAFAQLTPDQRRLVLESLNGDLPPQERADGDDPRSLARMATRAELRRPGTLERTFGGFDPRGSTVGAGGLMAGSFLNTIAAVVIGTAIADAIFDDGSYADGYQDGADAAGTDQGAGEADAGYDGGDLGGGEF